MKETHIGGVHNKYLGLLFLLMVLISGVLFFDFIIHNRLYIFYDIGGDTRQSYWPIYQFLVDAIKEGTLRSWSFQIGLGTSTFTFFSFLFDPFLFLLLFFTRETLPIGILVVSLVKILASGYLFYLYIHLFSIRKFPAVIAALIWAFNGFMMLWGQHYWFASMLVLFTLLMYAVELWLRGILSGGSKVIGFRSYLFPVCIAFLGINSPYFLFMISIFLFFYVTFHYLLSKEELRLWDYSRMLVSFFGRYFLGLGAAAASFLPVSYLLLSSPRISGDSVQLNIFQLASIKEYVSIYLRLFSNNSVGVGSEYFGVLNYYEGPMLSSSLLVILVLPQLLFFKTQLKNKLVILLGFLTVSLLFVFPVFTKLFNAFSSYTYRWNFIIVFVFVFAVGCCLQKISENEKVNYIGLIISALFVVLGWNISYGILVSEELIPERLFEVRYVQDVAVGVGAFLVTYGIVFLILHKKRTLTWIALTAIVSMELIYFNFPAINARSTVSVEGKDLKEGYYDYTNEAIAYLKKNDKELFRVDKNFYSYSYNDALFQKYNGLKSYNSLNNPSYVSFIGKMDIESNIANVIGGFDKRSALRNLVGVKYVLAKDERVPLGFEKLKTFHDVNVYKNPYSLPIAFTYDKYMTEAEFAKLTPFNKDQALMNAAIVKEEKDLIKYEAYEEKSEDLIKYKAEDEMTEDVTRSGHGVRVKSVENGKIIEKNGLRDFVLTTKSEDPYFVISLPENKGQWKVQVEVAGPNPTVGAIFWHNKNEEYHQEDPDKKFIFSVDKEAKAVAFDIYSNDLSEIRFDPGYIPGEYKIKNLQVLPVDYEAYQVYAEKFSGNRLNINHYENDRIEGKLSLSKREMLFFSIPYDKGWELQVDGKKVATEKVNGGFVGAVISKGEHNIKLEYHQPLLKVGIVISSLCWVVLVWLLFRGRKTQSAWDL